MFGMCDTSVTPALGYMKLVPRRNAATLLPIIAAHVAPGTTVYSDKWSAYNRVTNLPGVAGHGTVNHTLHFVDPTTGIHTQNIESYWDQAKLKLKWMKGCHKNMQPSYLDEFIWREPGVCSSLQRHCTTISLVEYS